MLTQLILGTVQIVVCKIATIIVFKLALAFPADALIVTVSCIGNHTPNTPFTKAMPRNGNTVRNRMVLITALRNLFDIKFYLRAPKWSGGVFQVD